MTPNRRLSGLLRQTARRLEAQHILAFDLEYKWNDSARCNCGLLVREALDLDEYRLRQHIYRGTWKSSSRAVYREAIRLSEDQSCPTTGLKLDFVFRKMSELGLDQPHDFESLEYANHPQVLERLAAKGQDHIVHYYAPHVALYMREMADWIDEQVDYQETLAQWPKDIHIIDSTPEPEAVKTPELVESNF